MSGIPLNLTLPTAGTSNWDGVLNPVLQTIIDAVELEITPDVINMNAELDYQGNGAKGLIYLKFSNGSAGVPTSREIYFDANGELIVSDGSGNQVQVTSGGLINASSTGGITGLAGSGASVTYSTSNKRYTFLDQSSVVAAIDVRSVRLENTANTFTTTLQGAPTVNWTMTLPTVAPASTSVMTMTSAGTVVNTTDIVVDSINSNGVGVFDGRVTANVGATIIDDFLLNNAAAYVSVTGTVDNKGTTIVDGNLRIKNSTSYMVNSGSTAFGVIYKTIRPTLLYTQTGTPPIAGASGLQCSGGGGCTFYSQIDIQLGDRVRDCWFTTSRASYASLTATLVRFDANMSTITALTADTIATSVGISVNEIFASNFTGSEGQTFGIKYKGDLGVAGPITIAYDRPIGTKEH